MSKIKNIVFDLGGVFLKIDYQKTEDAFVALGITNFASYYKQDFVSKLFDDFETGKLTAADFCNGFRNITQSNLTDNEIKNAWNSMLLGIWEDRLIWLEEISKYYNVFLFSNTNTIHYDEVMHIFNQTNTAKLFSSYFIKDYYSHILGLRKPNVDAYIKVLDEQHLQASETLFIDDTLKNIEGAKQAGLLTLLLLPSMDLETEVSHFLQQYI